VTPGYPAALPPKPWQIGAGVTPGTKGFDFLARCRAGDALKTRDRRTARITRVLPEEGLILGEVEMAGPCAWRCDGRYRDAPAGAAGPLDLMPPAQEDQTRHRTISLKDALAGAGRLFCCD
jgi:hypothetical protein